MSSLGRDAQPFERRQRHKASSAAVVTQAMKAYADSSDDVQGVAESRSPHPRTLSHNSSDVVVQRRHLFAVPPLQLGIARASLLLRANLVIDGHGGARVHQIAESFSASGPRRTSHVRRGLESSEGCSED
ncbi:hypothetical protein EVAR_96388_1 [Eumeta japonica]|uniref:Uncharacterized protein n=1 Tax=Eumeta variegata TaxID=151549 RepID=A0A4C1WBS9_EUMVA|nr:hypothetical protein EVAR_96388_1 [Eumeta japonica]